MILPESKLGERLLRWGLDRAPKAQAVNLESHEPGEEALMNEVRLVRSVL